MKWWVFILLVIVNVAVADNSKQNSSQAPQVVPAAVVSNTPQEQQVAAELFSQEATYEKFTQYNPVKPFDIPRRDDD